MGQILGIFICFADQSIHLFYTYPLSESGPCIIIMAWHSEGVRMCSF